MKDYAHIEKPDLGYRYEFATDELDANVRLPRGARVCDCQRRVAR